jgi:hypothetical protein
MPLGDTVAGSDRRQVGRSVATLGAVLAFLGGLLKKAGSILKKLGRAAGGFVHRIRLRRTISRPFRPASG